MAGHLEEMLSLAKSSEQYSQYMMGSMQDALAPAPLDPDVEKRFRSGPFSVTIRELIAYYIAMVSLPCPTLSDYVLRTTSARLWMHDNTQSP